MKYTVYKTFLNGPLSGMTVAEQTSVTFVSGKTYNSFNGITYRIDGILVN